MAKRLSDFLVQREAKDRGPRPWQMGDRVTFTWRRLGCPSKEITGVIKDTVQGSSYKSYRVYWVDDAGKYCKWWVIGRYLRWPSD